MVCGGEIQQAAGTASRSEDQNLGGGGSCLRAPMPVTGFRGCPALYGFILLAGTFLRPPDLAIVRILSNLRATQVVPDKRLNSRGYAA